MELTKPLACPSCARNRIFFALILLVALALRAWGLDQHNVWWDEGLTSWAARLPVPRIIDWTAHDVHPPLYFLLTRVWWLLIQDGAWGLRFLPVLAGVTGVALVYGLARSLGGVRAAQLSAAFLALSPFAVTWSQELRMYIFAAAWAGAALWAAVHYWQTGRPSALAAYVLTAAAALWTLYLSVTVLIIANLAFLVLAPSSLRPRPVRGDAPAPVAAPAPGTARRRTVSRLTGPRFILAWFAAQALAVALFAPWLAHALPRMMSWSSAESFTVGLFLRLYGTVLATGIAENIEPWALLTLAVFAVLLLALAGIVIGAPPPRHATGSKAGRSPSPTPAAENGAGWSGGSIHAAENGATWSGGSIHAVENAASWSGGSAPSAGLKASRSRGFGRLLARATNASSPRTVPAPSSPHRPVDRAGLLLLILGLILPALLVLLLTVPAARRFYVPRLAPRYFLPLAASFYILLGWGLTTLARRSRLLAAAGTTVVLAASIAGLLALLPGRAQTDQYASLVATLRAHQQPGERVLLYPDEDWPLFAARYPHTWEKVPAGMKLAPDNIDGLLNPIRQSTGPALWVVTTPKAQQTDPAGLVPAWLDAHSAGRHVWQFGETSLTLFAFDPQRARAAGRLAPQVYALPNALAAPLAGTLLWGYEYPLSRYGTGDTLHVAAYWDAIPSPLARAVLTGPARAEASFDPPPPVPVAPYRQLAHLPLTPDLPPGRYQLSIEDDRGGAVRLGDITIVGNRSAGSSVREEDIRGRLDARVGEHVTLVGYALGNREAAPGEDIELTLYWRADAVLTGRYKVFTHLAGDVWNAGQGNFLWGQWDAEPCSDQCRTTTWRPGALIEDRYRIPIAPDAPPGLYRLEAGMYGLLDGARLPVRGVPAQDDAILLGEIRVRSK